MARIAHGFAGTQHGLLHFSDKASAFRAFPQALCTIAFISQPIRHAFETVAVEPKGDDPADDGHASGDGPVQSRWRIAKEGCADDGDEAVKWIPVEQRATNTMAHDVGAPNDRCDVEKHLHGIGDDLGDVAEAGADHGDNHHHPQEVEDEQHQPWNGEQGHGRDWTPKDQKDQRHDKEVVPEDDKIFPNDACYVDPERHFDLKDNTTGI